MLGLLISALYNIVDQIFIGNSELGYLGNAATGVSFPVICIANAFAWCVGDGAAAVFPFYLLLNVMNSMIRADRSPAFAMVAMLAGAIINIILDPIFIFGLKWGIAGAAWATAIGQVASFLMCAIYFFKLKNFKLTRYSFLPNIPISVFSIQTKVYTVVGNIVTGIVLGGQPIFGYNYGAKKLDRVRETYKIVLKSTLVVGIIATLIFEVCPHVVIGIFGSGNGLYQEFATKTFRIYLSPMTITCLTKKTAVFFQSIGKSIRAVVASLIRDILCFTPLAILLPHFLEKAEAGAGINGILYAAPMADLVAIVVILGLTIPFFRNLNKEVVVKKEAHSRIKPSRQRAIESSGKQWDVTVDAASIKMYN